MHWEFSDHLGAVAYDVAVHGKAYKFQVKKDSFYLNFVFIRASKNTLNNHGAGQGN